MNEYFDEYKNVLKKYADFEGRATVREFWSFYLINSAAGFDVAPTPLRGGVTDSGCEEVRGCADVLVGRLGVWR